MKIESRNMEKQDFSREIFDNYYGNENSLVKVLLKDGRELQGIFVGVFHGETGRGEPYILNWHFVESEQIDYFMNFPPTEESESPGLFIKQSNIQSVSFRDKNIS